MRKIASIFIMGLLWTANTNAAPLTFNTALPISEGEYIVREQLVVSQSGDDPSGANRDRTELSAVSTLVYGVTPDFALFGTVPYTDIDTNTTDAQGIGNTKIFGRYTLYQNDFQGGTFRVAPFAGVKIPTNQDNTGTDSWDSFGGVVATYGTIHWEVDGQISYQANTEADSFEAGDITRADVSLQYRLFPITLSTDTHSFINGVLEVNLIHKDKNKTDGIDNPNSGGTTLFLVPGLQYAAERYILEAGIQIPVIQDLNGMALENDYIFRTGFRLNF